MPHYPLSIGFHEPPPPRIYGRALSIYRPASSFLFPPLLFYSLYKGFSLVRFTISRARVHKRIRVYGSPQKSGRRNQFFSRFLFFFFFSSFFLSRTNCSKECKEEGPSSVPATIVTKRKKNRYLSGEGISLIGERFDDSSIFGH